MSVEVRPDIPPAPEPPPEDSTSGPKPRLKRLRFVAIVMAVLVLGLVSFVFGIFISVASDLPSLTKFSQLKDAKSSVLLDDLGHPLGVVSQQNRVIVTPGEIPPIVKEAVISIEDKRAAVHQERAAGAVAPDDLREAQRGRARLPALAQVVEGKDHHGVPEHDLLR
jgi:membrane peptidoglycan carboxypeptidase